MSAGSAHACPALQKALDFVRNEDAFIVTKPETGTPCRRSGRDRQEVAEKMLTLWSQGIDTTTGYGRLQFNLLAAIGECGRELIRQRQAS
jgi:DNA invertase Pin-like site-specific DNA recombinase